MRSRPGSQLSSDDGVAGNGYNDADPGGTEPGENVTSSLLSSTTATTRTIADIDTNNVDQCGRGTRDSDLSRQNYVADVTVDAPPLSSTHSSRSSGHPHDDQFDCLGHISACPDSSLSSPVACGPIISTSASVSPGHARYTVTPKDVVVTIVPSSGKMVSRVVGSSSNLSNNNNEYCTDLAKDGLQKDNEEEVISTSKAVCAFLGNRKLLLFLLLIVLLVVAAAVVIGINFGVKKSSEPYEEETAWANETAELKGESETTSTTSVLTSTFSSSLTSLALTTTASSTTTSTSTESSTPVFTIPWSSCDDNHFDCIIWEICLPWRFVCDGYPDCPNGRDEKIGCDCRPDQYKCTNGKCVSRKAVCNGTYECMDRSDEANCPNCPIRCESDGVCIWGVWHWCNGIFDCDDLSDEMNCPKLPGMRRCSNGVMVETQQFCDGVDHCGDNSDEDKCSACPQPEHIPCSGSGGRCIPARWRCDGHQDCSEGEDELHCANCTAGQFVCADYYCIDSSLRCDGKVDCGQRGGDEENCLSLSSDRLLLAVSNAASSGSDIPRVPVCAEGWTDAWGDQACALMGARSLQSWDIVRKDDLSAAVVVIEKPEQSPHLLSSLKSVPACKSNQVVQLLCKELACGEQKVEAMDSLVASGDLAPPGKWPWVVSLSYLGTPICGGVVIGRRWVLTAAHCIKNPAQSRVGLDFTKVPFYFTVKAGATNIYMSDGEDNKRTPSPSEPQKLLRPQTFRAVNISFHPKTKELSRGQYNWDLALVKLDVTRESPGGGNDLEGLEFTDFVQPICLPSLGDIFSKSSHCYIAGWGMINYYQYQTAHDLRDARMSVWPEVDCRNASLYGETITDTNSSLCGGFLYSGAPSACKGDSGGPLMCLDSRSKRYKLAGIISRGGFDCSKSRRNRVLFARVSMAVDWIRQMVTES